MHPITMGCRVVVVLAMASFAVAQLDDLQNRVSALERVINSIMADFPQYFAQNGITDYLEMDDNCYKCDDEVSKLQETIANQTQVISELEWTVEALTTQATATDNFIANPGTAFYNYLDEVAQATCSAIVGPDHWVWAMPRDCAHGGVTCHQVCVSAEQSSVGEIGRGSIECFDAFRVKKTTLGLRTYHYSDGCAFPPNRCGPNYCCCRRAD